MLTPPSRLSILDTYPTPSYINPSGTKIDDHPIRYLSTSSAPLPSSIHPFSPPNLLSTQTLSSSLICLAQQYHLTPTTTLKEPTVLLLLPRNRIPHPPPRVLEAYQSEDFGGDDDDVWSWDVVLKALGLVKDGIVASSTSSASRTTKKSGGVSRHNADDGMYI